MSGCDQNMPPSPALPNDFLFADNPSSFRDPAAFIVRLPCGIRSKQKLFAVLADKLRFPGYFGWNWDALEECLCDRSWLPPGRPIVLVHQSLPFGPRSEKRRIYLDILKGASGARSNTSPPLSVVLPTHVRGEFSP
jgi:hypothetical protein